MDAELLGACELAWDAQRRVSAADGACVRVLGKSSAALLGLPLHEALGIGERQAQDLDRKVRQDQRAVEFIPARPIEEPTVLRLALCLRDEGPLASVVDAHAFLAGAPPLQISRLASSLSHEIRNPLSSVKMAVQTLARNAGHSERDARRLAIANREIRTMERMLGLLSEYARELPANREQQALRTLLQDALTLVNPELAERRIAVVFEGPEDLPRVHVEGHRLRLVLAQLLLNVAMALPVDATLTVQLRPGPEGGACILLTDPAANVLPEERATLFEPFGSRLARGAGLSLAALRRVLQAQGGDVSAEPLGDGGALFTLTFPA
jgi:two-component system sensor histidine kinase HydH